MVRSEWHPSKAANSMRLRKTAPNYLTTFPPKDERGIPQSSMALETARVTLRPWQRTDDDEVDSWTAYNDPFEVIWNLPRPGELGNWSFGFEGGSARRSWAVEDRSHQLMGRISLREIDEQRGQARLGVTFGPHFVGQGLGTDALRLFIDYFFTELGFRRMVLDVAAPNLRAVRCYERLGFRYVSSDWRAAGSFFDTRVVYEPRHSALRRHFRSGVRGMSVEFFEMQLDLAHWLGQRPL
jgi:RimJ/RimL family protein N-acetyltransferase